MGGMRDGDSDIAGPANRCVRSERSSRQPEHRGEGMTHPKQREPDFRATDVTDMGGDPACWAHRVCQQCGRLNEAERPEVCESCGAAFPDLDD
jgi:rubrerythrin